MAPIPTPERDLPTAVAEPYFKVAEGQVALEGPAFDREGNLLFVDIYGGRILRLSPDRRLTTVYQEKDLHPGGIATNIARNSRTGTGVTDNARRAESIERFDNAARTTPEVAAKTIADGIERNAPRILIGFDAKFIDLLQRLRPATYWKLLAGIFNKRARLGEKKQA